MILILQADARHIPLVDESVDCCVTSPPTLGWKPSCACNAGDPVVAVVLDPFAGSGTTGRVALELGRRAVLLDLKYHDLAVARTSEVQLPLADAGLRGN